MKTQFKSPLSVSIAISSGLIVLLGYFFGTNADGNPTLFGIVRDFFVKGAVLFAATALLVGLANLASVHLGKIRKNRNTGYSAILLISMLGTLCIGVLDIIQMYLLGESEFVWTQWIFTNIQLPVETSLMAILAISLTLAAARLLRCRMTIFSVIFSVVMIILLVSAIPQLNIRGTLLGDLRNWIIHVPAVGGARGILFGVALGTIATGIRILIGSDRPYRG